MKLVKQLAAKLSYQGKELNRRIANQMQTVEKAKASERKARLVWLSAQLNQLRCEEELNTLLAVHALHLKKGTK